MRKYFCFVLVFIFLINSIYSNKKSSRNGRQLDLDAILEGKVSNHVIGERQSRNLNQFNISLEENLKNDQQNKTGKDIYEENSRLKHASYIPHFADKDYEDSKDRNFTKELVENSARVLNNLDQNYATFLSNPYAFYPSEDKILATLMSQANSNNANEYISAQLASNPQKSQSSSLGSFLNLGNNGLPKKKPFSTISSSIQEFAASVFSNKLTNKFIKRKQSGTSQNHVDYTNFAQECICVPFYMCRLGYIEQNNAKPGSNTKILNPYDQQKLSSNFEVSNQAAASNQNFEKLFMPSQLPSGNIYQDEYYYQKNPSMIDSSNKPNQKVMADSYLNNQNYNYNSLKLNLKEPQEYIQNLPKPSPLNLDQRYNNHKLYSENLSSNNPATKTTSNDQESSEKKNTNNNSESGIDERSLNDKADNNSTDSLLQNPDIDALTRMFGFASQSSNQPQLSQPSLIQSFPQQAFSSQPFSQQTFSSQPFTTQPSNEDVQNCGVLRTCCPILSQQELFLAQQSASLMQAQNQQNKKYPSLETASTNNLPLNMNPNLAQQLFAFENFQNYDQSSILPLINQQLNAQANQPQSSQANFVYQPVFQQDSNQPMLPLTGSPYANKETYNNVLNNKKNSFNLNIPNINSHINGPPQTLPNSMPNFTPFQPLNKWLNSDNKKVYQTNSFSQPSLSSFLLTKNPVNFQARNPSNEFLVDSTENKKIFFKNNDSQICGIKPKNLIQSRIDNLKYPKDTADFGEYPWQAALLKRVGEESSLFVCGATLISDQWVLTTAHCLKKENAKDIKIRLGEWDVYRDDEVYPFVERNIAEIIRHPNYDSSTLANDIALLRLEKPIDYENKPHILPVCKAETGENFAGKRCWVAGWGKDTFGKKGTYQSVLRKVELPVLDHSQCSSLLQQTRLGNSFDLHPGFICAGGEKGKDACEGDGGSALVCESNGYWKAAGLVSWGIGCGKESVPGVYVNLGFYENWIDSIINPENHKKDTFTNNAINNSVKNQLDFNTLTDINNGDLLSESSNLLSTVIKKQNQENSKKDLSSVINERTISEDSKSK